MEHQHETLLISSLNIIQLWLKNKFKNFQVHGVNWWNCVLNQPSRNFSYSSRQNNFSGTGGTKSKTSMAFDPPFQMVHFTSFTIILSFEWHNRIYCGFLTEICQQFLNESTNKTAVFTACSNEFNQIVFLKLVYGDFYTKSHYPESIIIFSICPRSLF